MAWHAIQLGRDAQARIQQAQREEQQLRLEAILGVEADIGPLRLRPMTIRDVLEAQYVENRFVIGGEPDESDLLHLLFMLAPKSEKSRKKFVRKASKTLRRRPDLVDEIGNFIERQFNDVPQASPGKRHAEDISSSRVWTSSVIDSLAAEYGWSLKEILRLPVEAALYLQQHILQRHNGRKYAFRNKKLAAARAKELKEASGKHDGQV